MSFGKAILITECTQEDLMGFVPMDMSLPSEIHIGREEMKRILGYDPDIGSLKRLMDWVRKQDPETIEVIHIRKWHEPDPSKDEYIQRMGRHCIRDTPGANLVLNLGDEVDSRKNEHFINVNSPSDFVGTNLEEMLRNIISNTNGDIHVGVIGVWTDTKISYMFYELKTRLGLQHLGTCSGLTAGSSRSQHNYALSHLKKIFGVNVMHSVSEFKNWLLPTGTSAFVCEEPTTSDEMSVKVTGFNIEELCKEDKKIIELLFRNSTEVHLEKVTSGHSGAFVFKASSSDREGHKLSDSVVKMGPIKIISREMINFENVEEMLGNNAPRVRGYVDLENRAAIRFAFASMGEGKAINFAKFYHKKENTVDKVKEVLKVLFEDILGKLYDGRRWEKVSLFECYEFNGTGWSPKTGGSDNPSALKQRIKNLLKIENPNQEYLSFPGGRSSRNIARFLEKELPYLEGANEYHFISYVHGDIQPDNIIIDPNSNIWLIDFYYSNRTHTLKDITKIEADILFLLTQIDTKEEFLEAMKVVDTLVNVTDLAEKLPSSIEGVHFPQLIRAWKCIRYLRKLIASIVKNSRNPTQVNVPILRYTLFYLCLDDPNHWQKLLSLYACCQFSSMISSKYRKEVGHIIVSWFDLKLPGKLGVTLLPGRKDRGRNLAQDLSTIKEMDVSVIICLSQTPELHWLGVSSLESKATEMSLEWYHFPIRDQTMTPQTNVYQSICTIDRMLKEGKNVVVCCNTGLGRSCSVATCLLMQHLKLKAVDAMERVREIRGTHRAIESKAQEHFIKNFEKNQEQAKF